MCLERNAEFPSWSSGMSTSTQGWLPSFRVEKRVVDGIHSISLMMREQLVTRDLQHEMVDQSDHISVEER